MNSEKNWMSDNLYERIKNPAVDYNIKLNIQKFKYLCFHEAAEQVALKIANLYDKIYIGYSGGIDSEYVVSCFHRLKIPFKAIITKCSGGEEESEYAINFCKRKNIILEHLICKDSDLLEIFYNDIYKKLNGIGTETMPIIFASKYAKNNNGIFITGTNILGDGNEIVDETQCWLGEWDNYIPILIPDTAHTISFFNYTTQLLYSMIDGKISSDQTYENYKSVLYDLEKRPKIHYTYNNIETQHYAFALDNNNNIICIGLNTQTIHAEEALINKLTDAGYEVETSADEYKEVALKYEKILGI